MALWTKGESVTLSPNCRHEYARNAEATVIRYVKSRNVVTVRLRDGQWYDAGPSNVRRAIDFPQLGEAVRLAAYAAQCEAEQAEAWEREAVERCNYDMRRN